MTSDRSHPPYASPRRDGIFRRRTILLRFALLLSGCAAIAGPASAQQQKPEEYQVKAVYLFNFGRFTQWPATTSKDDSFDICVLGRDPFGAALDDAVAHETIDNQKLAARRIATSREAARCRILFVSSSEAPRVKEILTSVEKSNVLTVSDLPGFTNNGGMIQFVLKENKVRFDVNLAAAEKAGLRLSSQLLKVAADVKR